MKGLFKNKPFYLLFLASLFSVLGEGIFSLTIVYHVSKKTHALLQIGSTLVLTLLPSILLGPFLGVLLDRFKTTKIASVCGTFRFLIILLIPISYYLHVFNSMIFYLGVIFSYICWFVLEPTKDSILKVILDESQYRKGISYLQGISQVGFFLSAFLAGILIHWVGVYGSFILAGLTYVPSSVLFNKIFIQAEKGKKRSLNNLSLRIYIDDFLCGWSYLFKHRQVFYIGITTSMVLPFYYGINTLLAPFTSEVLKGNSMGMGLIDSGAGIGSLISSFFIASYGGHRNYLNLIVSILFSIIVTIGFSLTHTVFLAFIIYICIGVFMGNVKILSRTLLFQSVNEHYIGRVMGTISMLSLLNAMFSSLITAYIGTFSLFYAYTFIAGSFFVPGLFVIFAKKQKDLAINPLYDQTDRNTFSVENNTMRHEK